MNFGNYVKTGLLMAAIVALFGAVGAALGGAQGMLLALAFGVAANFAAYWFSDNMVLRMYNAHEVDETSAPQLYNMVRELAGRAGIPMPRVYLIDEPQPNAFATGRNPENAAVAATTGILQLLTARELRGVMAHELAHVKHCFATLHTNSCLQSINRIVDVFPPHQQPQIRAQLSFVLEGVLSQQLIRKASGHGRALALEVMVPSKAIRNLIREDKIHQIYGMMQAGQAKYGMQTMNQSLHNLYQRRHISYDDCISRSSDPDELIQMIQRSGGGPAASGAQRR